eukprot:9417681-Alexandrium_andersonii.AAC.1
MHSGQIQANPANTCWKLQKNYLGPEKIPEKPWIRQDTLKLLADRAELVKEGRYAEADALSKSIKKSARGDRKNWVAE